MGRPKKETLRVRKQVTLAPETSKMLEDMSKKTFLPMSNLLDVMILEYARAHEKELKRGVIEINEETDS